MPAPAPAENGVPRTELQELQLKSQQVTDENTIISANSQAKKTEFKNLQYEVNTALYWSINKTTFTGK
nr:unnamed protein product [Callosobruchus chinensis]